MIARGLKFFEISLRKIFAAQHYYYFWLYYSRIYKKGNGIILYFENYLLKARTVIIIKVHRIILDDEQSSLKGSYYRRMTRGVIRMLFLTFSVLCPLNQIQIYQLNLADQANVTKEPWAIRTSLGKIVQHLNKKNIGDYIVLIKK